MRLLLVLAVAVAFGSGAVVGRLTAPFPASGLERFCRATRDAIRQDRIDLGGSDPVRREAAFERFYEGGILYHGSQSILYCVDTLPRLPLHCRLNKDWHCLAELAGTIEQGLDERRRR